MPEGTPGRIRIHGHVFDGAGDVIPDAMIETWQADPDGRLRHRTSAASAARPTDDEGALGDLHAQAGPASDGDGQAPHIDVSVFARGMLNRCVTRIYFADEDNTGDPVLRVVPEDAPRRRSIAEPDRRRLPVRRPPPGRA